MANKMTFQGVVLLSFARNKKGAHATFSSTYTENVAKAMEWPVSVPEVLMAGKPEGELVCENLELIPAQVEMKKHTVSLGVCQVGSFQFVRRELEEQRGKGHRTELRFVATFTDAEGCRRLEQYLLTIGDKKGRITVSYQKQAKQEDLLPAEEQAEGAADEQPELAPVQ